MQTSTLWNNYAEVYYFFILKRVGNQDTAKEVLQNAFLKIHQKLSQLNDSEKAKEWGFQIVRNELNQHFRENAKMHPTEEFQQLSNAPNLENVCCFDRFIRELPEKYREVIQLVYLQGKKQKEVAEKLNISLANVKARIRRAKNILHEEFERCCKFETDKNGKLVGTPNCAYCEKNT